MIYELNKADYPKTLNLFTNLKSNTAIESIYNDKNEARLFVDNLENPQSIFILNSWAYYYLAGESTNEDFNTSLVDFLENDYFPECIRTDYNKCFAFYPDTDLWCKKIEELFSHLNPEKSGKTYFKYDKKRFNKDWRNVIPEGFKVERIRPEIIASIDKNQEFIDYITFAWSTVDQYFKKGLGYCALDDKRFATICISIFASESEREVGIKTFSDFRRKGLAYATACAYIEECLAYDYTPVWSCFSDNKGSMQLAEKLGYTIESAHPIYFVQIGE